MYKSLVKISAASVQKDPINQENGDIYGDEVKVGDGHGPGGQI